jgi:hypothetical protein
MGKERNMYRLLVGKPERDHWEDNIKMVLPEIGLGGADWIGMA